MLTVTATGLSRIDADGVQFELFEADDESRNKTRNFEKTVDKIRQKHGYSSVVRGYSIKKNNT